MTRGLAFISYMLSAMAGICFVGGIAVLSGGGKVKNGWA